MISNYLLHFLYRIIPLDDHFIPLDTVQYIPRNMHMVFALLCFVVVVHWLIFPISIRLTSLALWQSNDCPSASKATLMNMDKYFMWIHYERLHNHNKAKHNKTVCIFLGIYCRLPIGLECGGFRFEISCFVWHCILAVDFVGGDNHNYIFIWFTVRINNHYSTSEGVVQIFYDGEWGSICGDGCVDAFVWWIKLRFHWDYCDKIVLLLTLHEIRHLLPNGLITQ